MIYILVAGCEYIQCLSYGMYYVVRTTYDHRPRGQTAWSRGPCWLLHIVSRLIGVLTASHPTPPPTPPDGLINI